MLILLFIIAILLLSTELTYIGKTAGFIQNKFTITDLLKIFSSSFLVFLFLVTGYTIGNILINILGDDNIWYASTIIFILGIKLFYDGIKLHNPKQSINTSSVKGLLIYSILIGLNSFFVGLSFGLFPIDKSYLLVGLSAFFISILLGYVTGLKSKQLNSHRFEFLLGIVYIIIAIFLIVKL
jgi:putative Mn2+ efflux pump MntP